MKPKLIEKFMIFFIVDIDPPKAGILKSHFKATGLSCHVDIVSFDTHADLSY